MVDAVRPAVRKRFLLGVAVAVTAVAVTVVAVVLWQRRDDGAVPTTTSSSSSPSSSAATTSPPRVTDTATAVWPYAASGVRYHDPVAAARGFAVDFVGFTDPVVGAFMQGDARSGEVEVRPVADGPATTVIVRQLGADDTWWVLGSATGDIEVDQPKTGASISSPVALTGRARAFEGTVAVEIREDGSTRPIGTGFVTGSGGPDLGPFSGNVEFSEPRQPFGAIVFRTDSAEDGSVREAGVIRVRFAARGAATACSLPAPPEAGTGEMAVRVFFTCERDAIPSPAVGVTRVVPASPAVLGSALGQLLAGPSALERAAGLRSWFSDTTADLLHGVTIDSAGNAVVDFADLRPVIPNASSSAGSEMLLSELDSTVFQFPRVHSVEYRIDGSCSAFYEWLQAACQVHQR